VLGQRLLRGAHRVPIAGRAGGSPASRSLDPGVRRTPISPEAFNTNMEKAERADVTFLDYAIVARR
jgi:hypothetical protein